MKNSSNTLAVVLVLAALVVGGLLSWLTQKPAEPQTRETTKAPEVVTEAQPETLVASNDAELADSTVAEYLKKRWGEEQGSQILSTPDRTLEGRPLYRSKTVFVSTDRDGNPVITRPSYSPLEPTTLNKLDQKPIDREQVGTYSGPQVNMNDPAVRKHLEESRARTQKARLLTQWANQQIENGNVGDDGLPQLPQTDEEMDELLGKLDKADQSKSGQGGQGKKGKKKKAPATPPVQGPSSND
jgi:hypothetical protein